MTDIIEQTRAVLLADPTVSGMVGGERIYPSIAAQGVDGAFLVLTVIDGDQVITHDGPIDLHNPTVQIDAYAVRYADMAALFKAVKDLLNGKSAPGVQGYFLVRQRDMYDNDAKLNRRSADFNAWNKEDA